MVVTGIFFEKSNNKNTIPLGLLFRHKKEVSRLFVGKHGLVRQQKFWEQTVFLISSREPNCPGAINPG